MIDIKERVIEVLGNSTELIDLLGGTKHIYPDVTKNSNQYPRIVVYEIDSPDSDYSDDMPIAYEPVVQISIFSKEKTLAIFKEIDKTMKEASWRRIGNNETYEEDEQIYHRPTRYKNKFLYN